MFLGAGCFGGSNLVAPEPVKLVIWQMSDPEEAFKSTMDAYTAIYPNVSFEYKTFTPEEYEVALLNAWAKGEGPDIFETPNWRLGKYREFIAPMPEQASFVIAQSKKTLGKTTTTLSQRTVIFPTISQLRERFVDVVTDDIVYDEEVYGVPFSVDTLALYYNRDVMARGQVAVAPTTWNELVAAVSAIRKIDTDKRIVLPAAALGTADNLPYYFDILSLLMIQGGTTLSVNNRMTMSSGDERSLPAIEALDFFTKFSNPKWQVYTWNDQQPNALEAFTQDALAFYFGYYSDLQTIQERAPNLNFYYTKVPQTDLDNPINYANYMIESVHVNSKHVNQAWDFIDFMSTQEQVINYLTVTKKVPALRSLVAQTQTDPVIGIFAQQALTAQSWYHGVRPDTAQTVFGDMIRAAQEGIIPLKEVVTTTNSQLQLTLQ
ncbi:MAG: extracellular solute-binding protein [Candidatus Kerfeldbacteria bacterium]|nr:extracellular solute-binding protein [Candidatus Kerfeldbacteria bacterium]